MTQNLNTLWSSTNALGDLVSAGLAAGGVVVDVDGTIFVQIGIVVVLLLVLKPLIFDPTLKLFEERENRIDGAKQLARDTDKKSAAAASAFDVEMQKAQAAGNKERDRLRAEAARAENEVLAKVRAETAEVLDRGRKQAQGEFLTARAALKAESSALGSALASRVLGREVGR